MSLNNLIDIEKYKSAEIPMEDWNIIGVFGDILLCKFVDVADSGVEGDYILRGGIAVPLDVSRHTWRIVEVLKKGVKTSSEIDIGDLLMIPNDRGIPCIQKNGKKKENLIFINEDRVFCKVEKK
jgi:hypothetical protein